MLIYLLLLFLPVLTFGNLFESELRTVQVSNSEIIVIQEHEKLKLKRRGVSFMDISDFPSLFKSKIDPVVPSYKYPASPSHQQKGVERLFPAINRDSMYKNLASMTSFYTRYYKSKEGVKSAKWVSETLHNVTSVIGDHAEIHHFDHAKWEQFSIIVRILGSKAPENVVVFGSHHDSMNLLFPSLMPAPGADDNASGTVTNIEALRVYCEYLAETQNWPKNTVEFHFYSAEEGGLLGSLDIFTSYREESKSVVAMIQQDMTGYIQDKKDEHIGIVTDYTDPRLTEFVKMIIDSYLEIPYKESSCGYACSDHGSATKNGYPAAFVIESEDSQTNRYIHTNMDTLDRLSLSHMVQHVRLALGATLELGDWEVEQIQS
ncbi:LAMI_0D11298g1_1 [Lachancea mirantina]|uniref:Peptide hydrolase n=1 Tax=Lachancea mirantina TaxID=1230905 RepID=A0A1G4JF81_9SACH|nr:LAMI_0D11298g1_1 [Lachancea mirantina]